MECHVNGCPNEGILPCHLLNRAETQLDCKNHFISNAEVTIARLKRTADSVEYSEKSNRRFDRLKQILSDHPDIALELELEYEN